MVNKRLIAQRRRRLFEKPSNQRLANIITIESPRAFQKSITTIKKGGVTAEEKKALVLARTRAQLQLRRKNLSAVERRQFKRIARKKLPAITKR